MAKYRANMPQLRGGLYLTDGGIETTLIFHNNVDLPYFAAFHLLKDDVGRASLRRYFERYAKIARNNSTGFILESATWRASSDWGNKLGYARGDLACANQAAISLLVDVRDRLESASSPMVISGCVGPRGDGYDPGAIMNPGEAETYHAEQINVFSRSEADQITPSR